MLTTLKGFYWFKFGAWTGAGRFFSYAPVKHLFGDWNGLYLYKFQLRGNKSNHKESAIRYLSGKGFFPIYEVHDANNVELKRQGADLASVGKIHKNEFLMVSMYSDVDNSYVGTPEDANQLVNHGLTRVQNGTGGGTANIGFNPKKEQWFGWSHRAMVGFGVGDRIFDPVWEKATDETLYKQHGEKVIENFDDARIAASNFAQYCDQYIG